MFGTENVGPCGWFGTWSGGGYLPSGYAPEWRQKLRIE